MRLPQPVYRVAQRVSALWSAATNAGSSPGRHEAGGDTLNKIWREATNDPIYGAPLALAARHATIESEAMRCVHCGEPIQAWRRWWIHVGRAGTFQCRGEHGMLHDDLYAVPPASSPTAVGMCPRIVVEGLSLRGGGS